MNCPDRENLCRYQDGSLDAETMRCLEAHVPDCEDCQAALRELGRAELLFRIGISSRRHAECCGEEELGAYLSGRLSRHDRARVEGHLLVCQRCLSEVSALSSDGIFEPVEGETPRPDASALARMVALGRRPVVASTRRVVLRWTAGLASAAAALLVGVLSAAHLLVPATPVAGTPRPSAPVVASARPVKPSVPASTPVSTSDSPETVTSSAVADAASSTPQLKLDSDLLALQPDTREMADFAREVGLVLGGIDRLNGLTDPDDRAQAVALVKEDIDHTGLVNTLARLMEAGPDARDRRFLADCRDVLMRVVQLDAAKSGDIEKLVSDIRRLNLVETARMVELERGTAPWLASL